MTRTARPLSREREARLFEAAARVFLTRGFEASSLNRIIDAAGMQKSSFYHYFADKRDLHDRMLQTLIATLSEYVRLPDLPTLNAPSFWPAMYLLLDDVGRMTGERPETIELARVFHAAAEDDEAVRLRAAARSWTDAALARGVELGVVRADLPTQLLGDIAFAAVVAVDRWALNPDAGPDASDQAHRALEALRRLLEGS
ncbi:TetR/AcrR family transcriptional regulator [Microbacterium cremeum]|uniref:TetR/AcrR family transcriptional regulator n=1 Tax=Microbacterium cremeum TaxID=2782169 RepID=UPI0018874584|nr:TetR/AcrR family transcriptional regulator [Microbacterium cremeum]